MTTKYYYTADDVLDVKSVALIYSGRQLKSEDIPQYAIGVGMFEKELKIEAGDDGAISSDISGIPDYDSFKFNNILILDDSYAPKAFVELNSTIHVAEMGIRVVTVVFEYDVKTDTRVLSLSLDYSPHIGDEANAHKRLLTKGRRGERCALTKGDVVGLTRPSRNPYYASLDAFSDPFVKEGYLKYSGDLYFKDGNTMSVIEGNSFYVGVAEPIGFVEVGGEQAVACVGDGRLVIRKQSGDSVFFELEGLTVEGVSLSLMAFRNALDPKVRLYSPEDIWNGRTGDTWEVKKGTVLIADAVTGAPMLYTMSSERNIDWEASSESLRRILDSTMFGSGDLPGTLVAATEGLVIYDCDGTPMLCSGQSISNPPYSNRFLAQGYDKAVAVSGGAVLLRKEGGGAVKIWSMAELVEDAATGRHRWELSDFGKEGASQCFYPAIYKVSRRKETTPYSSIAFGLSYKGLLYTLPHNQIITSL